MKFFLIAAFLAVGAIAETNAPATTGATTETVAPFNEAQLVGVFEVRPSWDTLPGESHSENSVELGFTPNPAQRFSYKQEFNSNFFSNSDAVNGVNLFATDGYFKAKQRSLWTSGKWALNYEGRIYLPTWAKRRDAGMITAVRNYAKIVYQANDDFSVSLYEIPIVHIYNQSGFNGSANPGFENRVYLMADVNFTKDLALNFPVMINSQKMREFAGAANSGVWDHYVWINPELTYTLTNNYSVGLGYYNNTGLMSSDLSSFQIGEGLKDGVVQAVFTANL